MVTALGKCFFRGLLDAAGEETGVSDSLTLAHLFLGGGVRHFLALIARVQVVDRRVHIPPVAVLLRRLKEFPESVFREMSVRLILGPQQLDRLVVEVDEVLQLLFVVELHRVFGRILSSQEGPIALALGPRTHALLLLEYFFFCLRRRRQCLLNLAAPLPPGRVFVDARKFQL